jgi:D-alanyl-D-alanine carboxypeptidase
MAAAFAVIIVLAMLAAVIAPLIAATDELTDGDSAIEPVDNARYVSLFDDGPLAGTEAQTAAPPITGDPAADERIRTMAVERGYVLRQLPSVELTSIAGWPLHAAVADAWLAMSAAAAADGVSVILASGFRPVDSQRVTFLGHLDLTAAAIVSGTADAHIDYVLSFSAPPGYSKHHTGYAVDISEGTERFAQFESTAAFEWLSADDYTNARRFGFVPSYPPGVAEQGPNPEAWEYVWVGADAVDVPEIGFTG